MGTKLVCDICKEDIDEKFGNLSCLRRSPGVWESLRFWDHGIERKELLVCHECFSLFKDFVEEKKKEKKE